MYEYEVRATSWKMRRQSCHEVLVRDVNTGELEHYELLPGAPTRYTLEEGTLIRERRTS